MCIRDSPKPSAFESEIHPSHKSSICTPGISPLQGASAVSYTHLEAVKEVDERHLAGKGSQMGHRRQVHDLLDIALAQHGKAGLAAGHNVAVVAEDVQRLGGHGTGGHMEHCLLYTSRCV